MHKHKPKLPNLSYNKLQGHSIDTKNQSQAPNKRILCFLFGSTEPGLMVTTTQDQDFSILAKDNYVMWNLNQKLEYESCVHSNEIVFQHGAKTRLSSKIQFHPT
jgi:hypothetical protein